ncbi:Phospholipid phosphatase 5 [Hypsizygus marmoreus]|uniref:Phospholipid phosphatase 5 n=1 Tax=Hypsizygus marmoreus TaxID=39966 RepID=A0A369JSE1_HYPMA|nr:Phospholipid phosphatase 5 [Hypsizygus marmoreus]
MSYSRLVDPVPSSSNHHSMLAFFARPVEPGRERAPISPTRRRKLILSYLPDWIITIVLAALFFSLDKVDGYQRVFSLEDTSLRHPYAIHERVPNVALYFICFVTPLLIQPIINFFTIRSWWDLHNATLGLVLGLALTGSITQFSKITVGRPRPDIVDRCQPPVGFIDPPFGLTNATICTQIDRTIIRDGFRSFPSGHSSLSFAGLGFLAFYLAGKLHLFDRRGHAGKAWLALAPFSAAALVAISRTMDYRHHWHDVLVGSLLGTFISYFTYRQYYPSLSSELSHRPYSPRVKREETNVLPLHQQRPSSSLSHEEIPQTVSYPPAPAQSHQLDGNGYLHPQDGYHNPFGANSPPPLRPSQDDYELEGTVERPNISLEAVWKDGENEVSQPRTLSPLAVGQTQSEVPLSGAVPMSHGRSNTTA